MGHFMMLITKHTRLLAASFMFAFTLGDAGAQQVPGAQVAGPNAFEFVALGDMPYRPEDYEKVDRLIAAINTVKPAFTLHVGDIISGRTLCSDENLERSARQLAQIDSPLIYTPGDNEWTDCHRPLGGRLDPLDRLAKVRQMMFPQPGRSLGKQTINVEAQSLVMSEFPGFPENVRFEKNGVHIATAHVVGSNNNYDPDRAGAMEEFTLRNAANIAWLNQTFQRAIEANAKALVIGWQANVHPAKPNARSEAGFSDMIKTVAQGAASFKRPVLVVYGDYHFFDVRAFEGVTGRPVPGVTKLMVYGDLHVHAVRVSVDPDSAGVFGFTPLIVPANGLP
jgi:hypothetical protein